MDNICHEVQMLELELQADTIPGSCGTFRDGCPQASYLWGTI